MKKWILDKINQNGISYNEFMTNAINFVENTNRNELDETKQKFYDFTKLNNARSLRITKTFIPENDIVELVNEISEPQIWMVLTEDWCGDSAQNIPYLSKLAELNSNIELKIVYRDTNLDLMDEYLTNGKSRSIPKLVGFDLEGNELFSWGPRPKELLALVDDWKSSGLAKEELTKNVHTWYAKNKGQAFLYDLKNMLQFQYK